MGLEPTTATLATWRSTTELHPRLGGKGPRAAALSPHQIINRWCVFSSGSPLEKLCPREAAGLRNEVHGEPRVPHSSLEGWPGLRYSEAPADRRYAWRFTGASEYLSPGHPQ